MGRRTVIAAAMLGLVAAGLLVFPRPDGGTMAAQESSEAEAGVLADPPPPQEPAGFTAEAAIAAHASTRRGPRQPLPFSHRFHSGELQIPCLYCHAGTERSQTGVVPPLELCMGCHRIAGSGLQPVEEMRGLFARGTEIEWEWVYKLPEFVQFNHAPHIRNGLECQECHGPVEEMDRVYRWSTLTMGWCLECHRGEPEPTDVATDYLLTREFPAPVMPEGRESLGLYPLQISSEYGASRGPIDCLACHY